MSDYLANKGFIALFALLAVMHIAWGLYEWWWLFQADRVLLPDGVVQFKARWTAPILTTLAMSAMTLSLMVYRFPWGAMRMGVWFLGLAVLCHLGLLYFDPLRNQDEFSHWIPVIALGILAYKIIKRSAISRQL